MSTLNPVSFILSALRYFSIYLKFFYYLHACVRMHTCHGMHVGGQGTTCGSQLSPSTPWVPGKELTSSDLMANHVSLHMFVTGSSSLPALPLCKDSKSRRQRCDKLFL